MNSLPLLIGSAICAGLLGASITREVPYGGVEGRVVMRENGKPLPNAQVILRPETQFEVEEYEKLPEDSRPKTYVTESDKNGTFQLRNVRAGDYELQVSSTAHSVKPVKLIVSEGKPVLQDLELEPTEPFLDLYASQHVFRPNEKIELQIHGFTSAEKLSIVAYKLNSEALSAGGLSKVLSPLARDLNGNGTSQPESVATKVAEISPAITQRDLEGVFREFFRLPALKEGVYWVECKAGKVRRGTYLNVTRIAMVLKHGNGETLAYVTQIDSGKPVSGASIRYSFGERETVAGVTGSDGILRWKPGGNQRMAAHALSGPSEAIAEIYVQDRPSSGQPRIFVYTDRPIYRPGDTVQFKGIVRKLSGANYQLPGKGGVDIEVRDPDETLLEQSKLTLSEMGTFSGTFKTNSESLTGSYGIHVTSDGYEYTEYVSLAAYRKPEYSIKVTPEKPYYVRGERARVTVSVEYYFGSPVAGAKVDASILRAPFWSYFGDPEDQAEFEEYASEGGYGGEWIQSIAATTDQNGKAVIEFDTKYKDRWAEEYDSLFTVNASVTDGDKYFSGEGSVKVVRSEIWLSAEPSTWVTDIGKPVSVTVRALSHQNEKPLPGVSVKLTSGYEVWTGMESVFRPLQTRTVQTNNEGDATSQFTPNRAGSFVVRAEAADARGNVVRSSAYVSAYGGAIEYGATSPSEGQLTVRLDKKSYAVGDTAKVLIQSQSKGGSALITVEGEAIYSAKVVSLTDKMTVVDFPVTSAYRPNAFVSVTMIRDKKFLSRSRRMSIDLGEKRLSVSIASDKPSYSPGDTANYTIRTVDGKGKPVPAEVSLGVVDEAIFAIASDRTDIQRGFYPKRYNAVSTSYSFEELYLDGGDKAPSNITIRERFQDTAIWKPSVRTDASGKATVSVPLPDNLTTWRATAVAITADTAVGQTLQKARARKDLMVRVQTPAFFVQQDEQRVLVMVTNDSGKDADVNVDLQAVGIGLEGNAKRTVRVPHGATESLEWTAKCTQAGNAALTARAWINGGASDGMKRVVEVQPHGRAFSDIQSGEIAGVGAIATMTVRSGADPATGRLAITVSPSIASSLLQSLDELIGYPYGCTEQTMSRFMPTVIVAKTFTDLGLPKPPVAAQIPKMVEEGYARLRRMQHQDGGWGWWEYDKSDMFMTALVLEGVYRATSAGYAPPEKMVNRALDWAQKAIVQAPENTNDYHELNAFSSRLYLAYALALHGRNDYAKVPLKDLNIGSLSAYDAANVALLTQRLGAGYEEQLKTALKAIRDQSKPTSATVWSERWWGMETTARCLLALASAAPNDPLIPTAVRRIMLARRGAFWWSTRDTSYIVLALTEYWRNTRALELQGQLTVLVNGSPVRSITLNKQSLFAPDLQIFVPMAQLKADENRIEFRKTGPGICYFSAELRQTVVQQTLGPLTSGPGLTVQRGFYLLSPQRLEDGTLKLMPSADPVEDASRGDVLRCIVKVINDDARQFVMVEVPIPSNCRVTERESPDQYEEWSWWYDRIVIRDDRVAFFVRDLPVGTHEFTFAFQAENPGVAHALPVTVFNMYDPGVRSSSGENSLRVRQ